MSRGSIRKKIRLRGEVELDVEARRAARESVGQPPIEKVIQDKRRRPPKHKKASPENE